MSTLSHLNYLHVIVATIAGFILGWIWYSALFGKAVKAEMKCAEESPEGSKCRPAGSMVVASFIYTFISTIGLAMILGLWPMPNAAKGAELGAAIGLLIVGGRLLNGGVWEKKSAKLLTINLGHEVALFALQGAILAGWGA